MWKIELVLAAWTQKASARQWCLRQLAVPQAWGQSYAILPIFSSGLKIVPWGHHASPLCDFLCSPLSLLFFLFVMLGIELRASHTFRQIPAHQAAPPGCTSFLQLNVGSLFFLLCWSRCTSSLQHSTDSRKQEHWACIPRLARVWPPHMCFRAIGQWGSLCVKILFILVKVSVTVIKYHGQKQLGEVRACFSSQGLITRSLLKFLQCTWLCWGGLPVELHNAKPPKNSCCHDQADGGRAFLIPTHRTAGRCLMVLLSQLWLCYID